MAEIVESSSSSPDISDRKTNQEEEEFDPDTMRRSKPGLKRMVLTFSVLFSFLLGFPFLLKSIEIYRAPLPFKDIDSLSERTQSNPLQFPCNFRAIFVGFDSPSSEKLSYLQSSIFDQIANLASKTPECGTCSRNFSVSVTIESSAGCFQGEDVKHTCAYRCGAIRAIDFGVDDEITDDKLEFALGDRSGSGGKVYSVMIVNRDADVRTVIGKYRHAWIVGKVSEASAVSRVSEIFVKIFMNGGKEEGVIQGEFMPVGADGRIVLSFNLLNADPQDWVYDWDFDEMDDSFLSPIVHALGPLANITVESQVLYHTPKSSYSYWDDKLEAYIFGAGDLPFFVNSNEWHLDTSIAAGGRSKILHFVVYIPSAKECPLLLQLPNGDISKTKGFISPMWGGVIVWNPPSCLGHVENHLPVSQKISADDLEMIYEIFLGQLRQLFGLKSENNFGGKSGRATVLASDKGFTEWELDVLSRRHACFNLQTCATTLGSLSRLVQSLPRMIIKEEIGKQVELSIEEAKRAETDASLGSFNSSARSSRQARSLAEDAFFHPSIMSVSYYSFEHCFAVYSPFFLPVALHVVLAALRELKRYKKENKKYLTWKAKANASATS